MNGSRAAFRPEAATTHVGSRLSPLDGWLPWPMGRENTWSREQQVLSDKKAPLPPPCQTIEICRLGWKAPVEILSDDPEIKEMKEGLYWRRIRVARVHHPAGG